MQQLTRRTVLAGASAVATTTLASISSIRSAAGFAPCPTQPVKDFLAEAQRKHALTLQQRTEIVDEAVKLLNGFYAHLPLKRARYGVDPLERLRLLRHRLPQLPRDLAFHAEMIDIFASLRDQHTVYTLPEPYNGAHAWLPFKVEACFDGGRRRYFVSQVVDGYVHPTFRKGVEVLSWNGAPVERAAELAAPHGSTPAARHGLGLARLTYRWLLWNPPPQEDSVLIHYRAGGQERDISIAWNVSQQPLDTCSTDDLGNCTEVEQLQRFRKFLYAPYEDCSLFRTERITTSDGAFGYIRIFSFDKSLFGDDKEFVKQFRQHVMRFANSTRGLIIDVRDNGGGSIRAGERVLQCITRTRPIEPCRFYFAATDTTLKFCQLGNSVSDLGPDGLKSWIPSIQQAVQTGAPFSDAFEYASKDDCNVDIRPIFPHPVIVVTSALTYSSAEMFAAGFQDHGGTVLGVDETTGGGGAGVRADWQLRKYFEDENQTPPLKPLAKDAGLRVAYRRSVRVGLGAGKEIEDSGLYCNRSYAMTRNDLLNGNRDLKRESAKLLAQMT